jgi:HSP90 family molecular chaperone
MEEVVKHIKHCRPKLAEASVKTYSNILRNLYKDLWKDDFDYHKLIDHHTAVMTHLESVKYNVRKTILAALVCISTGKVQEAYRKSMIEDARQYNAEQKENKMTDAQRENWLSWQEIEDHMEKLKTKYYYIFKEKNPKADDLLLLQKYIVLCCYVLIPPRRCQDFCLMKVKSYDKTKDNFFEKGKFVFSKYKTAKFSGVQIEKVPKSLEILLTKWIKLTNNENLFFDFYGHPLTAAGMTKILNSIFSPKKVSVNILRHVYITEKSAPLMKQLEETAAAMGHSTNQAKLYVKED